MPKRPVPKNPRAEMSTVPKRPRAEMSALKIPKLKCAQKTPAETSSAEKSLCRNVRRAETSACENVHVKKFLT